MVSQRLLSSVNFCRKLWELCLQARCFKNGNIVTLFDCRYVSTYCFI